MANATNAPIDPKREFLPLANGPKGFGQLCKLAHKAVSRDLGYVLTLGGRDAWAGFSAVLAARLDPEERAELARAALIACEDRDYRLIMQAMAPCDPLPHNPVFDSAEWREGVAEWRAAQRRAAI